MLIKIEEDEKLVDTNGLRIINSGQNSILYNFLGEALKISYSGYMTREKVKDFKEAIAHNSTCRIIPPNKTIIDPSKNQNLKNKPIIGYTQSLLKENPIGVLFMSPQQYLSEFSTLDIQIFEFLTKNCIAITDTNPNNILATSFDDETILYLVDHDNDITPSSTYFEKQIIKHGDYSTHNKNKLALIMYKCLLLQILKLQGIGNSATKNKKVINYIEQEAKRKDINFSTTEQALAGYSSIDEYARDTLQKIKKR